MARRKKSLNPLRHLSRFFTLLLTFLSRAINFLTRGLLKTLRRNLPQPRRNRRGAAAGFVLPTIVMVSLVVVLVTTAVMIRSFDRSKNSSNFRVNEIVLNAATPALDRARSKISRLFSNDETNLPVGTPKDGEIRTAFESRINDYTFQDEDKLELSVSTRPGVKLKTAWRYPVDSNNNGKFDSYTLYGIYFNDPVNPSDSTFNAGNTTRTPLDARSAPMDDGQSSSCSAGVGSDGSWKKTGSGILKKAFFTYVATVPISETQASALGTNYEANVGNQGFSALEMQQDQSRLSLDNNAVFYEDDLEITFSPQFFVNGRVHTNGNLLVSAPQADNELVFLQVSSPESCFYKPENSTISVGGNLASGGIYDDKDGSPDLVKIHLFRGANEDPTDNIPVKNPPIPSIDGLNKTTTELGGRTVAYNDQAYQERLRVLTTGALNLFDKNSENWENATPELVSAVTRFPKEVIDSFKQKYIVDKQQPTLLRTILESYFAKRIRRVPFAEVSINTPNDAAKVGGTIATENDPETEAGKQFVFTLSPDVNSVITPPRSWMLIEDAGGNSTTKLQLNYLKETDPDRVDQQTKRNDYIGDRVVVGNNLPNQWFNDSTPNLTTPVKQFAKPNAERPVLPSRQWLSRLDQGGVGSGQRTRKSRIIVLDDIADTGRAGFWEDAASSDKAKIQLPDGTFTFAADETRGGLRVVTGAGIYIDGCPTEAPIGGFPLGFPCNGAKGLGQRPTDDKATIATIRSFLPPPPKFQDDPEYSGSYRLSLSPPNAPDTTTTFATPTLAGEDRVRVKLPGTELIAGEKPITVWSDAMPMWEDRNLNGEWNIAGWHKSGLALTDIQDSTNNSYKLDLKGDLQMRASAIYFYDASSLDPPPLACVSSYYDPSNKYSANASDGLPLATDRSANSKSPTPLVAGNVDTATNGRSYSFSASWRTPSGDDLVILQRQAAMVFPDGRLVNEPLRTALQKLTAAGKLTIADQSAIDAAMCALKILDGTATPSISAVPNGAIKEATLVDARQIKAIHKINIGTTVAARDTDAKVNDLANLSNPDYLKIAQTSQELALSTGEPNFYNLPIEQRQPMEVRVTELDIELLRMKKVGSGGGSGVKDTQEYLLPNSGIIYATRDDALPDLTSIPDNKAPGTKVGYRTLARMNKELADKTSATDFKLDSTRRPNGIRLIRGSNISRQNNYREAERGLTLATNVPVYLKADTANAFNLHAVPGGSTPIEEFTELVNLSNANGGNFYQRKGVNLNKGYACRNSQTNCQNGGDQWRAARIIADSITLLSNNFYDGVRSDSSFDQNNNGGNHLVEARLKNGFLWNSFGTSSLVANVETPNDPSAVKSSYWTNGITPIQRRVPNGSAPVYKMEICLKLPVAACQPGDWKQEHKVNPTLTIKAGTTATLPTPNTEPLFQSILRFPRRVAFNRSNDGSLLLKNGDDFVLGSTVDNKKLIVIKGGTVGRGTIPINKYPLSDPANVGLSDSTTLASVKPSLIPDSSAAGPTLWFGSGNQQTLKIPATLPTTTPITFETDKSIIPNVEPASGEPHYQQYVPRIDSASTASKGIALSQFFPNFNDIPGTTVAISTISDAAKYSFCIARPPIPNPSTGDPLKAVVGSGASQQVVVRTQSVTTAPGYVPANVIPIAAQSTILGVDPPSGIEPNSVPPTAIKPFEPYANPYAGIADIAVPVYDTTPWKETVAGYAADSYRGIDTLGNYLDCPLPTAEAVDLFRKSLVDPAFPLTGTGDVVFSNFLTAPVTVGDLVKAEPFEAPLTSPTKFTITAKPLISPVTPTSRSVTYIDLNAVNLATTPPTPSIPSGIEITLKASTGDNADTNPIFIFRGLSDDGIVIGDDPVGVSVAKPGVKLYLSGVDPNNVFWVSKRGITINNAADTVAATPTIPNPEFQGHLLAGNFFGNNKVLDPAPADSPLTIGRNTKVTAGRFLGFTSSNLREPRTEAIGSETTPLLGSLPSKTPMEIWAMNSLPPNYQKLTNQPIMAPILNIHSPGGNPSAPFSAEGELEKNGWIPAANSSTFNAVLVMGDSPARPIEPKLSSYPDDSAEGNGGLVNFPRFLESWRGLKVNIAGSLIQYKKSVYADAPYEPIINPELDTSLFFKSPVYTDLFTSNKRGFRYPGGANLFRSPYYTTPNRAWGYDVGLLSQPADLFSKRFSLPATSRPSEFFREVGRDDAWVKTLLCGKVAGTTQDAVDIKQRPPSCS